MQTTFTNEDSHVFDVFENLQHVFNLQRCPSFGVRNQFNTDHQSFPSDIAYNVGKFQQQSAQTIDQVSPNGVCILLKVFFLYNLD